MRPFYASKTPKELRDFWGTPDCIFTGLRERYNLTIDTAACEGNSKLPIWFNDALALRWADFCAPDAGLWCNPPFSSVDPWVDKWIEAGLAGRNVVAIVNSQTGAYWYHKALDAASSIQYSRGRVGFLHPVTGKPVKDNNLGQTIFTFERGTMGYQEIEHFDARDYNKHSFLKETNDE